ncbi:MAG: alkaline phosphatase family protein [Verrucomicrobia bacterium]|nr:alkaline phosphatase family protein [Verrucomicrobiota bacterium]
MKKIVLVALSILAVSLPAFAQDSNDPKEKKVLIIGVDGMRPDALAKAKTPRMDELIRNGAFADNTKILGERYRENNTISGPSWSSILTGVWADKHGVRDNFFFGRNFKEFPHVFQRIKAVRPEALTVSMVSWEPIDQFIVSDADIRHVQPLGGGIARSMDLTVSADSIVSDTRDGKWHHLVGRREGKTVSLFLNGTLAGSGEDVAGDFELGGNSFFIGRDTRTGPMEFAGELSEVRLWNRALTVAEIKAIAEQGHGKGALPRSVKADQLLVHHKDAAPGTEIPVETPMRGITQGDFTVEAWFKTTRTDRSVIMGNYRRNQRAVNLELQTDNRIRLLIQPYIEPEVRLAGEDEGDGKMAATAARMLREKDPTAMFIYFHQVDATGHTLGFSPDRPEYIRAIQNVDSHIGTVLNALKSRVNYAKEDWLIIVCTDHGGFGTTHSAGHDNWEINTAFLLVSGPSTAHGKIEEQTYLVDIVPTVLTHLGVPIDPGWKLDGRPVGLATR